ncbi:MAG: hypothetical protein JW873_03465 [Candidatus Saganbacteria bacterium]|nr:hypothetical protein [Candidatus Saganbacteria bacterium]
MAIIEKIPGRRFFTRVLRRSAPINSPADALRNLPVGMRISAPESRPPIEPASIDRLLGAYAPPKADINAKSGPKKSVAEELERITSYENRAKLFKKIAWPNGIVAGFLAIIEQVVLPRLSLGLTPIVCKWGAIVTGSIALSFALRSYLLNKRAEKALANSIKNPCL